LGGFGFMTFLEVAYKILKEKKKPLHSKDILRIALGRKLIETKGKTPEATMNAQLLREIKSKGKNSRFVKRRPSIFALNPAYKEKSQKINNKKAKKLLSEEFVKRAVIKWLSRNGWGRNLEFGDLRDQGVDIKVQNNKWPGYFIIETKGESKLRQGQEVAFVYSVGQIVTRMKVVDARYTYNYGLGLPESSAKIAVRRIPWQVAKKLCLYVFSVNDEGKVKKYGWQDLKKVQKK